MRFKTPPAVLNLLIINLLAFLAIRFVPQINMWCARYVALNFIAGEWTNPVGLAGYMFLHAGWEHLFFNMFALWMFGRILEYDLGTRRFLLYYFVCGIGAGLVQLLVNWIEWRYFGGTPFSQTIGASGAVFGILLAFGMLHPNERLMLLFPPIPMKAKWFVIGYGVIELALGITGSQSSVAHFAHLGGMLFGFGLILYWRKSYRRRKGR